MRSISSIRGSKNFSYFLDWSLCQKVLCAEDSRRLWEAGLVSPNAILHMDSDSRPLENWDNWGMFNSARLCTFYQVTKLLFSCSLNKLTVKCRTFMPYTHPTFEKLCKPRSWALVRLETWDISWWQARVTNLESVPAPESPAGHLLRLCQAPAAMTEWPGKLKMQKIKTHILTLGVNQFIPVFKNWSLRHPSLVTHFSKE